MIPTPTGDLEQAFRLYFAEMEQCTTAGHHFALLHVIVALPDVCAALEDPDAPVAQRYEAWCGRYHSWAEVLHRGGMVAKDPESPYVGGRSLKWIKVKQPKYREEERGFYKP